MEMSLDYDETEERIVGGMTRLSLLSLICKR
jgi:hypothetical protein